MPVSFFILSTLLLLITQTHTSDQTRVPDLHHQENTQTTNTNLSPVTQPVELFITHIIHALFGIVKDPYNKESRITHIRTILFNIFQIATTLLYNSQHKSYIDTITVSPLFMAQLQIKMCHYAHELQSQPKLPTEPYDQHPKKTLSVYSDQEKATIEHINYMLKHFSHLTKEPNNNNVFNQHCIDILNHITGLTHTFGLPIHLYDLTNNNIAIIAELSATISPEITLTNY